MPTDRPLCEIDGTVTVRLFSTNHLGYIVTYIASTVDSTSEVHTPKPETHHGLNVNGARPSSIIIQSSIYKAVFQTIASSLPSSRARAGRWPAGCSYQRECKRMIRVPAAAVDRGRKAEAGNG